MPRYESAIQAIAVVVDKEGREQHILIPSEIEAGREGQHEAHNTTRDYEGTKLIFQKASWT